jgi:hypothetical protein
VHRTPTWNRCGRPSAPRPSSAPSGCPLRR